MKEIDSKINELEGKYGIVEEHVEEKQLNDQSEQAIKIIREVTSKILLEDDLRTKVGNEDKEYSDLFLTIVSWFNYLKNNKKDSSEYQEAVVLLRKICEKNPWLNNWTEDLIEQD